MLIGKIIYDWSSLDDLIGQVEAGNYSVPTTISREMVSFLNGMLQYDPKRRLTAAQLSQHPFLTKNVSEFTRINTERASKKNLSMNTKKNQTIWGIFKDEKQLLKIGIGNEKNLKTFKKLNTTDYSTYSTGSGNMPSYIPNNPKIVPSHSGQNMNKYNFQRNAPTMGNNSGLSFYGQKMSANNPTHQKPTFNHSNTLNPNIINNIMLNQMTHGIAKQPNFIDNSGLNNPQSQYRPMDNDDSDEQKVCVIM
jgi:serine/threonine protein kinase